jgi:hypothetical protein
MAAALLLRPQSLTVARTPSRPPLQNFPSPVTGLSRARLGLLWQISLAIFRLIRHIFRASLRSDSNGFDHARPFFDLALDEFQEILGGPAVGGDKRIA